MNLRPLPFGSALTHSHCSLINMHVTSDKSREVTLRGKKSWEPKYSNPVNNTSEIKEVIHWKQKNIQRVSHLGQPARSGNTGGPPYDVMVQGLLRNLEFSLFWMYILLQTLEMWLASHSCKHPLYLRIALVWFFFSTASFANPSKSHLLPKKPEDLINRVDPEPLPIWGTQDTILPNSLIALKEDFRARKRKNMAKVPC